MVFAIIAFSGLKFACFSCSCFQLFVDLIGIKCDAYMGFYSALYPMIDTYFQVGFRNPKCGPGGYIGNFPVPVFNVLLG